MIPVLNLFRMTDSQVSHLCDGKKSPKPCPTTFPKKPFLKWVGGKRFLLPELLQHLPEEFNSYYEPFLGGGALFFSLAPKLNKVFLSDLNQELIKAFQAVKENPAKLIAILKVYESKNCEKFFYQLRAKPFGETDISHAARFVYLNKTCFGGLYRENQYGKFNVPFGHYESPKIADHFTIAGCSKLLKNTEIAFQDFASIKPEAGDFIYFDPPYHGANSLVFSAYNKNGFGIQEHIRLKQFIADLTKKGVHVMLSGLDSDFMRELYKENEYKIYSFKTTHRISNAKSANSSRNELIITNY